MHRIAPAISKLTIAEDFIPIRHNFRMLLLLFTNRCNLACKHCYVSSSPAGERGIPLPNAIRLLDEVFNTYGHIEFSLSGGEALVRREECLTLLKKGSSLFKTWLLTNGTLLTPSLCKTLRDLGIWLRISLDGGNPQDHDFLRGKGAFARTVSGLNNLAKSGFDASKIRLFCTISPETTCAVGPVLELAEQLGISQIKFEPICKTGRAREFWPNVPLLEPDTDTEQFRLYFAQYFHGNHGDKWDLIDLESTELSWGTLNVYSDGSVYPFTYTNDQDQRSGYLGNIISEPLASILEESRVSRALVSKLIMFGRFPQRSLHAYVAKMRVR